MEAAKVEVLGRIKGAISVARDFPRDEATSLARIISSCANKGLASKAVYAFPRGKQKVSGASIRLAEALAQRWTNLDFGVREIDQRDGYSVVEAYCWDLETNVRQTRTFTVKHERLADKKVVKLTDPRDIYEHIANYAARRMRACILAIIPKEITDRAVEECRRVMLGKDERPLTERVATMLSGFEKLGVRQELIERRLGHDTKFINEEELQDLREIYTSMHDKVSKRSDWFDVPAESSRASEVTQLLEEQAKLKIAKALIKKEEEVRSEGNDE
jgi:hypothetical protein